MLFEGRVAGDVIAVPVRDQNGRRRKPMLLEIANDLVGLEARIHDDAVRSRAKLGNIRVLLEGMG